MQRVMQGTVHGRTIQLEDDPQIANGSQVEVVVRVKRLPGLPPRWTPGSRATAAGLMADHWTSEDDRILEEISLDRKRDSRREPVA